MELREMRNIPNIHSSDKIFQDRLLETCTLASKLHDDFSRNHSRSYQLSTMSGCELDLYPADESYSLAKKMLKPSSTCTSTSSFLSGSSSIFTEHKSRDTTSELPHMPSHHFDGSSDYGFGSLALDGSPFKINLVANDRGDANILSDNYVAFSQPVIQRQRSDYDNTCKDAKQLSCSNPWFQLQLNPNLNNGIPQKGSKQLQELLQMKLETNLEIVSIYREKLLNLVSYYKKNCNNGYGLIPIINSFTAKHKFDQRCLETSYSFDLYGLGLSDLSDKKKDFCSKLRVTPNMKTVLFEVEFVNKIRNRSRWGIFQGVDFLVETGEKLVNFIDCEIVIEMDGGVDLCILRTVEYMPLVSGIQEIPFMPALRLPNSFDRLRYDSKDYDERIVKNFCIELLRFPEFRHYNMKVSDVEFQIDRKKLIIFAEFVSKVKFNKYVKQVYEHCKTVFRKRNVKPRIFIQNKFV